MPIDSEVPYVMQLMLKGRRRRINRVTSDEKAHGEAHHQKQRKKPEPKILQANGVKPKERLCLLGDGLGQTYRKGVGTARLPEYSICNIQYLINICCLHNDQREIIFGL